ncbi:isoaspartyl peptidase/L-asparaginase family protein [Litoribacter populi]|uniref:isoaspartyl peptidase/L-asparaginase family protein n=1 Tax=Litoribacter populi TaxID=2598460 RepID=UPI00117D98C5|nr:N(4)-(beta-N-acetylglucosaminyl)-L-asparaginase [Litoribacter populi]
MSSRRKFLKTSLLSSGALLPLSLYADNINFVNPYSSQGPLLLSTWNHGIPANEKAWEVLGKTGSIVDAVEQGVMVTESDLSNLTVGLQGLPDREGIVTLDAAIMKGNGACGTVSFVRQVKHPITLARKIMEETPHVMLSGEGARQFAIEQGLEILPERLSPEAEKAYKEWKLESEYKPIINIENHDTIGMVGLDKNGNLAGSCTTSGLAFKMHGRVGDSPIIGAGLFIDDEVGAATATGLGESIIRICGSFLIVELMRQGWEPQKACEEAVKRLIAKNKDINNIQAGFLAINKEGEVGAYSVHPGFNYAKHDKKGNFLIDSKSKF